MKVYAGNFFNMQRVRELIAGNMTEGIDGSGVTVAVLDTGLANHPDLNGRQLCFRDFVGGRKNMYDDNGHGTHVCGILCGNGSLSGGQYRGIASGISLVVGKVLDEKGDGETDAMLEGMDWVLKVRSRYRIRILNISVGIGSLEEPGRERTLRRKVEELWEKGILVVCAAGNKGPGDGSISAVGSGKAVTVGCHDGNYALGNPRRCETYSGRGYSGSLIRKPDLVAPGVNVIAPDRNGGYTPVTGTSFATPFVTGAAALLMQWGIVMGNDPYLYGEKVKAYLRRGAKPIRGEREYPNEKVGWGSLCVENSLPV